MVIQSIFRRPALVLAIVFAAFALTPAQAQDSFNPTAQAVQEQQLLDALQEGEAVSGRVSIPDKGSATLIKPEGRDWSSTLKGSIFWLSALILLGMLALLAVFYLVRGRVRLEHGFAGRTIKRFNSFERFAHWLTAVCFILLALTGLNLTFGRAVILPVFGAETFASLTQFGKLVHNYIAWPFMLGIAIMLVVWIKDNIPGRIDLDWLKAGGGIVKKGVHPPAKRFNAGQKLVFWAVIIGGAALSFTGILLLFPEMAGGPGNWQWAQLVHGIGSAVMVAVIFGHIYIGTLGMEGAFDAMGTGKVDVNWAREHHALWVAERDDVETRADPVKPHAAPAE